MSSQTSSSCCSPHTQIALPEKVQKRQEKQKLSNFSSLSEAFNGQLTPVRKEKMHVQTHTEIDHLAKLYFRQNQSHILITKIINKYVSILVV